MTAVNNVGSGPLSGVRVLDLSQAIAGPMIGRIFADLGADVVKVEWSNGDITNRFGPKVGGITGVFLHMNAGKRGISVDRTIPGGTDLLLRLADKADVVIENFKPGTMEKWGLGYDVLSRDNPGLVMLRLSGFGQTGPMSSQAGFGSVGESMGGLRYVTGFPDRPPIRPNLSIGDAIAALHGVIGALMALQGRAVNGGKGQVVDVALYEAVFNMMESVLPEYAMFGEVRERAGSSLPGIVPSNTYLSRDGQHIVIGANADNIFKRLMHCIARDDLGDDPFYRGSGRF